MKTLATLLLLLAGLTAIAQQSNYRQDISDDGKNLNIRVDRVDKGKEFHYANTFDVRGMNDTEKSALVRRVLESVRFEGNKTTAEPSERVWVEAVEAKVEVASMHQTVPFTKSVVEDTIAQRIKVSYQYVRNGEEHSYERTINKQGRTKEEIEKLIEETEESIGFSVNNS